ncbi:MAG: GTP cyclohydrolase II [Gammaproteobacteria bacterium]|nr:GTP cyclohydrolase II [Gammaproteobacteria bacterium]
MHSQCLTGDTLYSLKCDCGSQLAMALEKIASEGKGMIIYMAQEGRGIGLVNKIRAYELQDQGMDTVEANEALGFAADERDYSYCKEILSSVNISSVKLMTNNPRKINGLEEVGIKVTERVPVRIDSNKHNENYLKVKADKLGHMLAKSD